MARKTSPPPEVDPREFNMLNDRFYASEGPHIYFDNRLAALASFLDFKSSDQDTKTFRFDDFEITTDAEKANLTERDRFAAEDSTVLLHHACESLLRLLLAHLDKPPCPWLALAELRTPGVFMSRVRSMRSQLPDDTELVGEIMDILALDRTGKRFGATATDEKWREHRAAVLEIVRFAAEHVVEQVNLYNSAKHGFGINAGVMGITIGDLIGQDGPSITYVEYDSKEKTWNVTTSWVHPVQYMGAVFLISQQIRNLWKCARARYAGDRTLFGINNLSEDDVKKFLGPTKTGFGVDHMRAQLHTVRPM